VKRARGERILNLRWRTLSKHQQKEPTLKELYFAGLASSPERLTMHAIAADVVTMRLQRPEHPPTNELCAAIIVASQLVAAEAERPRDERCNFERELVRLAALAARLIEEDRG
jgi:hypothetical protein